MPRAPGGLSSSREGRILVGSIILWTHAVAGAVWIGACGCFVIAGLALRPGSDEQRDFAAAGAYRISVLGLGAGVIVAIAGVINLIAALQARGGELSGTYLAILVLKIVLYVLMLAAMGVAQRTGAAVRVDIARGRDRGVRDAIRQMIGVHAATLVMGAGAMLLGLWLVGS